MEKGEGKEELCGEGERKERERVWIKEMGQK